MYRSMLMPEQGQESDAPWAEPNGRERGGHDDVRVAVIIPAYGQPGLAGEALRSALEQRTDFPYAVIIVNDGCPQEATHQVCHSFAAANPGQVFYLRKRNGGLSAARNSGIDFALAAFPALEAVYFLDGDNRIGPHLLQRLLGGLRAGGERTGWAYADVDKFGFSEFGDLSGPYSPLEHLFRNVSDAGSMASRRMLDAGIRFDTGMRRGAEDWEFWLQGIEKGFRGVHVADAGFRYRRRGESMLVAAERDFGPIMDYIRQQHPALFAPRAILEREVEARSRLAIYHPDTGRVRCLTAIGGDALLTREEYLTRLLRSTERPGYGLCPGHLAVMDDVLFAWLGERRLLAGMLWLLECALQRATCAAIRLLPGDRGGVLHWRGERSLLPSERPDFLAPPEGAHVVMIEALGLLVDRMSSRDFPGVATQPGKPLHALQLEARIAGPLPEAGMEAGEHLAELGRELATAAETEHRFHWRSVALDRHRAKPAMPADVYGNVGLPSLFPCAADGATRHAAFVLEAPASNALSGVADLRRRLAAEGWTIHLVVIGNELERQAELEGFAEIVLLPWRELRTVPGQVRQRHYLGTVVGQLEPAEAQDAVATLAGYDLVVTVAGDIAHTLMGSLRSFKVKTWCVLASGSEVVAGERVNACASFEPAYDAILTGDERMRHLCRAWGIPDDKLHRLDALAAGAVRLPVGSAGVQAP